MAKHRIIVITATVLTPKTVGDERKKKVTAARKWATFKLIIVKKKPSTSGSTPSITFLSEYHSQTRAKLSTI